MAIDENKLGEFMNKVVSDVGAAMSGALVVIGDRLGLYRAMAALGPTTAAELATRTETSERYVSEWLNAQAAGGYITYDATTRRYTLPEEQAFALALVPVVDVAYTLPPAKKKKDAGAAAFGGMLAFAAPEKPGIYQVTLSGEGWIDLVQNGAALDSADHSGAKNCPGLRKSVRFEVGATPVVLQISGAPAQTIKIAVRRAE